MPQTRRDNPEKFYKIDKKTKCWNWIGSLNEDSYPIAKILINGKRKDTRLSRYFYEKYKGKIPEGLQIDHLCRNIKCVNPDHLEAVTQTENIRRGLSTKLKVHDITLIRFLYEVKAFTQKTLGEIFEVKQCQISRIINFKRWKEI